MTTTYKTLIASAAIGISSLLSSYAQEPAQSLSMVEDSLEKIRPFMKSYEEARRNPLMYQADEFSRNNLGWTGAPVRGDETLVVTAIEGQVDIYKINPRAANPNDRCIRLTNNPDVEEAPIFAPDGAVLYRRAIPNDVEYHSILEKGMEYQKTSGDPVFEIMKDIASIPFPGSNVDFRHAAHRENAIVTTRNRWNAEREDERKSKEMERCRERLGGLGIHIPPGMKFPF